MNTENNVSNEDKIPMLLKAEGDNSKHFNPMIQLLSAIAYLGVFGSVICGFMIIMSAASDKNNTLDISLMSVTITVFAVCIAAVIVLGIVNKNSEKKLRQEDNIKILNARRTDGKVVGVVKHINHVAYRHEIFDETIWNFKINYFNEEKNCICTVESDRYLNDISTVLANDTVTVYIKSDGKLAFDGYKLRKSFDDDYIKLEIEEDIQDTEV